MQEKTKAQVKDFLILNVGTLLTAVGTYFFKFPNNFSTGVTGLSVVFILYYPSLSNVTIVSVINFALLILGLILLGKEFGFKTFYVTIAFSAMLKVMEFLWPMTQPLTDQPFMELLLGVFLPAWGSAMLFNIGSSTGGTDIVAMILHKYTSLEIGRALLVSDLGIVLIAAYLYGAQTGLYCILGMILKCTVVDSAIESLNLRKVCTIISKYPDQVEDFIINDLHRSATEQNAFGVYTKQEQKVLMTVLTRSETNRLRIHLRQIDPHAFITIVNSSEIIGKGFRSI